LVSHQIGRRPSNEESHRRRCDPGGGGRLRLGQHELHVQHLERLELHRAIGARRRCAGLKGCLAVQGPQVIRQAQLSISVGSGSFDSKLADVRALVQREQGFISGTDAQANPTTNSQIRTGVITFMVPAAKFDETIDLLTGMGKVQNEHISGNDVSAQYVDLQARLGNEEAQRDAMLALLQRAQTVADIIAVQNQLGQITGQIEQLKGQIAYIDHNTAYSTVTVDLAEAGAPVQTSPQDNWGFVTALSDAAHNFVATLNYLVTGLGAVGPVVILLGFGYLLWRRRGFPGWPAPRHV
jgi:hypothetical protein